MNKRELIEKVAEKIGTMAETLKKGEKISLLELGSFAIRERKERNGYNPNSKENMVIPAKKVVKFSIGKYFFD
ncbi:MAG: HU family DNA-binding protein [Butyricimonas paravirosa]